MGKVTEIVQTDLLIIGCGAAGLSAALGAVDKLQVTLSFKGKPEECSTALAQGGIAAALGKGDSTQAHLKDTLFAGAGLCDRSAVSILTSEGLKLAEALLKMSIPFDHDAKGVLLGKEAAHSQNRILHVGDSTGAELQRGLWKELSSKGKKNLKVYPQTQCLSLIVKNKVCYGAIVCSEQSQEQFVILAKNTILATGGYASIFRNTTNHLNTTGDGIALAYQAGAVLEDMEFVQFHPTALFQSERDGGQFLISEAVRGEGAVLRNVLRSRFMPDYDPLAELAPRDIVTRAIIEEMNKTNTDHVLLDLSKVKVNVKERFPTIYRRCKEMQIDLRKDLIPVVPAAHYTMGGIKTDLFGRTNIKQLFACGEVAATGVHGANRLASNSLLEGLVFGHRAAKYCLEHGINLNKKIKYSLPKLIFSENLNVRQQIKEIMWQNVGIIRQKKYLDLAWRKLVQLSKAEQDLITYNMLTCALLTTQAALRRKESRGSHFRLDYPNTSIFWRKHQRLRGSLPRPR